VSLNLAIILRRHAVPIFVAVLGLVLSLLVFESLRHFEQQSTRHQYESTFKDKVNNLTQAITAIDKIFQSTSSVLGMSPYQSNSEFGRLIDAKFLAHTGIKGLEWALAVPRSSIAQLEARVQQQGVFDFRVHRAAGAHCMDAFDGLILPIVLAQPMVRVGQNLGLTLGSDCRLAKELSSSIKEDHVFSNMIEDSEGDLGVRLIQPLRQSDGSLLGVLQGVVMINELVDDIWRDVVFSKDLTLSIYADAAQTKLLYASNWQRRCMRNCTGTTKGLLFNATLPMGDQLWYVGFEVNTTPNYFYAYSVTLLMFVLTCCLSIYLFSTINRVRWANNLVEERTETLAFRATHDDLTGLLNRQALRDILGRCHSVRDDGHFKKFSLLFIDLDHFKKVNDTMGHLVGDKLLQQVSQRLLVSARADDMVFRFGGDEFVLILTHNCEKRLVQNIADRILEQLQRPFLIDGNDYHIGASIGATLVKDLGENTDEIMRNADIAMYEAKSSGRGKVIFFNSLMYQRLIHRQTIERSLLEAIEGQQLVLHYQPIFGHQHQLKGFEGLCRWVHPERGIIFPDDFISIAEESGLIGQLGDWVIEQACQQLAQWMRQYGIEHTPYISVNVSPSQMKGRAVVGTVERCLAKYKIPGRLLAIELTESALIDNKDIVKRHLLAIRRYGVRIFLDDFGTGYSSLSLLQHFPIDVLKIDRSFVVGIAKGSHSSVGLVQAIIKMAHALDMEVVAEGVEGRDTCHWLMQQQCESMQGYYFSKPITGAALLKLLDDRLQVSSYDFSESVLI